MEEAGQVNESLGTLKLQLALVQTGCLMAMEGEVRATSSELLFRARKEWDIEVLPSVVGQLLGSLGLPSTTSKGKSRFILQADDLQAMGEQLESQMQDMEDRVEVAIKRFGNVAGRLVPLEERFHRAYGMAQRAEEIKQYIEQHRNQALQLKTLGYDFTQMRQQLERRQRLVTQIKSMEEKLAQAPDQLQARRADLTRQSKEIEEQEAELAEEEKGLQAELAQLKTRGRTVHLASLEQQIGQRRRTLEQLAQQIEEERSLLDRLLGRNRGRGNG